MKPIDQILSDQIRFEAEMLLVTDMLILHRLAPRLFGVMMSPRIRAEYEIVFDEKTYESLNPEHFWDSLNELANDIFGQHRKFVFKDMIDYSMLDFAGKKKKSSSPDEIAQVFHDLSSISDTMTYDEN